MTINHSYYSQSIPRCAVVNFEVRIIRSSSTNVETDFVFVLWLVVIGCFVVAIPYLLFCFVFFFLFCYTLVIFVVSYWL